MQVVLARVTAIAKAASFAVAASAERFCASTPAGQAGWQRAVLPPLDGSCSAQLEALSTLGHRILAYSASCARNGAARAMRQPLGRARCIDRCIARFGRQI